MRLRIKLALIGSAGIIIAATLPILLSKSDLPANQSIVVSQGTAVVGSSQVTINSYSGKAGDSDEKKVHISEVLKEINNANLQLKALKKYLDLHVNVSARRDQESKAYLRTEDAIRQSMKQYSIGSAEYEDLFSQLRFLHKQRPKPLDRGISKLARETVGIEYQKAFGKDLGLGHSKDQIESLIESLQLRKESLQNRLIALGG